MVLAGGGHCPSLCLSSSGLPPWCPQGPQRVRGQLQVPGPLHAVSPPSVGQSKSVVTLDGRGKADGPPKGATARPVVGGMLGVVQRWEEAVLGLPGLAEGEGALRGRRGAVGALSPEPAPGSVASTIHSSTRAEGLLGRPEAERTQFPSLRAGSLAVKRGCVCRNVKPNPGALWEVSCDPQEISGAGEHPKVIVERGFQQRPTSLLPGLPGSRFALSYGSPPPGSPPCLPSRSGCLPFSSYSICCMSDFWCTRAVWKCGLMSLSHHQASCGWGHAVFVSVSPWPAHSRCSRDSLLNNMEAKNLSLEGFGDQAKVSLPLRTLVHRGHS